MPMTLAQIVDLTGQYGPGWAVPHARRVLALAHQIAEGLPADWLALEYAAYLHDWGAFPHFLQAGLNHAQRSRQVAEEEILPQAGLGAEVNRRILEAIDLHDYRDTRPAAAPEALLLREADFLDFLGAVGLARECAWGPNDLRACLGRAAQRKDLLAKRLTLPAARAIAAVRLARMEQILAWIEEESAGEL